MILSAIAAKLKRRAKDDFEGRHFEGLVASSWMSGNSWHIRRSWPRSVQLGSRSCTKYDHYHKRRPRSGF